MGTTNLDILDADAVNAEEFTGGLKLSPSQELTATGTALTTTKVLELNHATVAVVATLAAGSEGLFIVKDTSASGTAAHTLTLTAGTFDGTNNKATFNAPLEALVVYFDSSGEGVMVNNQGAVALSAV